MSRRTPRGRRITFVAGILGAAVVSLTAAAPTAYALSIEELPPPAGRVGTPYVFRFNMQPGSGSPGMTWRISSGDLPPGLSLSFNGERWADVSGVPARAGTWSFYLQAIDPPGPWVCCSEDLFSITIAPGLAFSQRTDAKPAQVASPYSWRVPVSGASRRKIFVANGRFPPGLWLNGRTGVVAGTPLKAGSYTIKIWVIGDLDILISRTFTLLIR